MKILWINDMANFAGGAETYIYQSAQVLHDHYGVENILLYNIDSKIDFEYAKVFSFTSVLADLQEQINFIQPDVVYVHQVHSKVTLEELSQLNIPVVGFVHDHKNFCLREHKYTIVGNNTCTEKVGYGCYSCLGFINKKNSFPYVSFKNIQNVLDIQEILKNFDHMIVGSKYMQKHLLLHDFKNTRITPIPLFSKHINNTGYSRNILREKRLLFVGQLIRGKGVDILLEAFSQIKHMNVVLDICGDGNQRDELEKLAKRYAIADKVIFHGKISSNKLSGYYENAYAVVIPSRAPETFNLVGLEAMKHSKAVIATDVGGIREWLEDGLTGYLFPSNDVNRLGNILEDALSNPQSISRMGQRGYIRYSEKFTPAQHCSQLYTLLSSLVKTRRCHAA